MASVASAAIIEGSLIIGLDDGSIINCGFVQGPQGLKGDPGPMGATGDRGLDGNTIHTVAGTPRNDMGRDGDYAIDNINWRIYGPKSGGVWGKAKEMLPGPENIIENGRNTGAATGGGGAGGSGGGDGGGPVFTSTVIATGSGRLAQSGTGTTAIVNYPGSPNGIIDPEAGMGVQSNINGFLVRALEQLEVEIPVYISEDKPTAGLYDGKLWFDSSEDEATLYIRYTDPDGSTEWMPAAPPVSLEGIEQSLYTLTEKVSVVETGVVQARVDVAGNAGEIEAVKTRLDTLENAEPPEIPDVDLSGLVEKDGDTMTGTLQINGTLDEKIDPLLCRADGYYMSFGVSKNGDVFAGASTSNPFLATENWHVVTKGYLDQALPVPGPAKYAWRHRTSGGVEPADGYMHFDQINLAQRHEKMYFNPTPWVGPKFQFPSSKVIVEHHGSSTSTDSPICSVWDPPKSDGTWELRGGFRIERIETDSNGILVVTVGQDGWGSLGSEHGTVYFTIGGLF